MSLSPRALVSGAPAADRIASRVAGGVVGLLVGDALGVPYEFHAAAQIPPVGAIEFAPPIGFSRAHSGVPPGTWSDDGAQALCLLASLLDCQAFVPGDFGRRIVDWHERGYMAVEGKVFDVGVTTRRAVRALIGGQSPLDAGPAGVRDNGNGSLMRVLPLALWHLGTDAELIRDAHLQSRVTHGHLRSQVCCALYSLWARRTLRAADDGSRDAADSPWRDAVQSLREHSRSDSAATHELDVVVRPDDPSPGTGSGYVVDALRSARSVVAAGFYEDVVRAAIRLGDDTDTTACIAGGIAGVRDGIEGIPSRWREGLRGREIYEPLVARLVARLATR